MTVREVQEFFEAIGDATLPFAQQKWRTLATSLKTAQVAVQASATRSEVGPYFEKLGGEAFKTEEERAELKRPSSGSHTSASGSGRQQSTHGRPAAQPTAKKSKASNIPLVHPLKKNGLKKRKAKGKKKAIVSKKEKARNRAPKRE